MRLYAGPAGKLEKSRKSKFDIVFFAEIWYNDSQGEALVSQPTQKGRTYDETLLSTDVTADAVAYCLRAAHRRYTVVFGQDGGILHRNPPGGQPSLAAHPDHRSDRAFSAGAFHSAGCAYEISESLNR